MLGSAPDDAPILNPQVMCLYIFNNNIEGLEGGEWVVLVPARKVRDRGFVSCSGIQVSKKQNVSSLLNCKILNIVSSLRDRELVCSAVDQQGSISNPVSGGQ